MLYENPAQFDAATARGEQNIALVTEEWNRIIAPANLNKAASVILWDATTATEPTWDLVVGI
jgi:hypothetical protein